VGLLLVLLDLRIPTVVGSVDLLPDAVGWLIVFLVARRAGWRRVTGVLAAVGVVSLVDEVRVGTPQWIADVQAAYQVVAVFGYVVVAAAAQAWCAERGDDVGAARYARHGRRLPFALVPAAATLFLVLTAKSAGPLTMALLLLSATAFLIVAWLALDLLRAGRAPIGVARDSGRIS